MQVGKYLKEARMKAKLSQMDVAIALGYKSAQYISNWERGVSGPPQSKIRTLSGLFGIPTTKMIDLIMDHKREQVKARMNHEI